MRRLRGCAFAGFTAAAFALAPPAFACPICDSGTGEQVRAGILGEGLAAGLLATLLPFALTAGVVAVVHFGGGSGADARTSGRPDDGDER